MIFFYFQASIAGARARLVGFSTEAQFLAYFTPRRSTHNVFEAACDDTEGRYTPMPVGWAGGQEALYPICEHGLSLDLCSGPNHYMTADQERAMNWQYADAPSGF